MLLDEEGFGGDGREGADAGTTGRFAANRGDGGGAGGSLGPDVLASAWRIVSGKAERAEV